MHLLQLASFHALRCRQDPHVRSALFIGVSVVETFFVGVHRYGLSAGIIEDAADRAVSAITDPHNCNVRKTPVDAREVAIRTIQVTIRIRLTTVSRPCISAMSRLSIRNCSCPLGSWMPGRIDSPRTWRRILLRDFPEACCLFGSSAKMPRCSGLLCLMSPFQLHCLGMRGSGLINSGDGGIAWGVSHNIRVGVCFCTDA